MSLDIVVVNYHTPNDLASFLDALNRYPPTVDATLTIVDVEDDNPLPATIAWAGGEAQRLAVNDNIGYARACNLAAAGGAGEVIALFNADTEVTDNALDACHDALINNSDWGVLGPRQVDRQRHIRHAGIFGSNVAPKHRGWQEMDIGQYRDVSEAVTVAGSAYFIKRHVWEELAECSLYLEVAPNATGAFLPTQHYYEESFCLSSKTMVWTTGGPKPISDIKIGDRVYGFDVQSGSIQIAPVSRATFTGSQPVLRLHIKGRTVDLTANHPVLAARGVQRNHDHGVLAWVPAGELTTDDCLVVATDLPDEIEENPYSNDFMQFWGMYVGDGCHDQRSITICKPDDARIRLTYEDIAQRVFSKAATWTRRGTPGVTPTTAPITIQDRPRAFRFSSAEAVRLLLKLGFDGTATTKRVPAWVFRSSREQRLAFLAGIVDFDGSVAPSGQLVISFSNRGLIEDIRQLLVSCGLPVSAIAVSPAADVTFPQGHTSSCREAYRITCSRPAEIPFADPLYRGRVFSASERGGHALARKLGLTGMAVRRIHRIEHLGSEDVYDLTVPDLESFVADGVVVHNCSYHARAHGHRVMYFGLVTIIHQWHQASKIGGWAEQQMPISRELFRRACRYHGIACD